MIGVITISAIKLLLLLAIFVFVFDLIVIGVSIHRSQSLLKNTHTGNFSLGNSANPKFRILIDGDSVGAGVGTSGFEKSLGGLIGNHYADKFYVELVNESVSGAKMKDLVNKKMEGNYDLAVVIISSNDLFKFTNINDFENASKITVQKYSKIADNVIFVGPGRVFEATAIPHILRPIYKILGNNYSLVLEKETEKYNNTHHASPVISKPFTGQNTLAKDNFHPNDEGVKFWFKIIKPYLAK